MHTVLAFLSIWLTAVPAAAQTTADAKRETHLKWWREARFGMFIHWGLYAVPAGEWNGTPVRGLGEWIMANARIPRDQYAELTKQFNPIKFNADEWVQIAKDAGIQYIVITSKHHDGFAMFGSKASPYNIVDATPFHRDPLKELATACRKAGIRLGFYYSHVLDWHEPEALGINTGVLPDEGNFAHYYANKAEPQIRELLTNYGPIGSIVFDGYWPRTIFEGSEQEVFPPRGDWDLAGTYDLIHDLQPNAVVCNNHHILPLRGEDYQVWELDFPGENTTGFNTTAVGDTPKAVWWNLNSGWAYAPRIHAVKSPETILRSMRKAHGLGAVFMLNVGPRPYGDIHPEEGQALRQIGQQMRDYRLA